jgi:hypothetical protein
MSVLRLTDMELVFLVLAVIYLCECVCLLRGEAVCFSSTFRWYRPLRAPSFLGNADFGVVIPSLLPLGRCFVCEPWPLAISPRGIALGRAPSGSDGGRFVAFPSIQMIQSEDRELLINGRAAARLASPEHAKHLAAVLREIAAAKDRRQAIEKALQTACDVEAITKVVASITKTTVPLRFAGAGLFLLTFAVGPVLYYVPEAASARAIWAFGIGFAAFWFLTFTEYLFAAKALSRESVLRRIQHAAMMLLSPASAMRSADKLQRHALAAYHPLAVAAAICPKPARLELARATLLRLRHPLPAERPPEDEIACGIEEWFHGRLAEQLQAAVCGAGLDASEILAEPDPLADAHSYCPRCQMQYVLQEGTCTDCPGMPLRAFTSQA